MSERFQISLILTSAFSEAAETDLGSVLSRFGMVMERGQGQANEMFLRTAGQNMFEDKGAVSRLLSELEQLEGQGIVEEVKKVPEPRVDIHWTR